MLPRVDGPKFSKNDCNPLKELSELRLDISSSEDGFDVTCQLRFSTGEVSLRGREYTVGITEARLQLSLEGCETALGCDFGSAGLAVFSEDETISTKTAIGTGAQGAFSLDGICPPSAHIKANAERHHNHVFNAKKILLPMTAVPGNAWRVREASLQGTENRALDGAAIDGERLCKILRKDGGNRMQVVAELQVRRSSNKVNPTKGDIRGKLFSLKRNKDAVVAKVLEKAIRREAATIPQGGSATTVVASKAELTEE